MRGLDKYRGYVLEIIDSSRFILMSPQRDEHDQIVCELDRNLASGPGFIGLPQEF